MSTTKHFTFLFSADTTRMTAHDGNCQQIARRGRNKVLGSASAPTQEAYDAENSDDTKERGIPFKACKCTRKA